MTAAAMYSFPTSRDHWRKLRRDERGAALIELAAVIPVIMLLGLGVLEFANYLFNYQLIQNGVRDAARFAASLPYDSANTGKNDAKIKNLAVTGLPSGGTARVSWWSTSNVTVSWSTVANPTLSGNLQTYRYSGAVPIVTVSANVPYTSLGFLGFLGLGTSINISASHQERVFGVR